MDYQYPISNDWSTEEVIVVIHFFECVEQAYERGIDRDQLMKAYRQFKEIIRSKAEEKQVCGEFEETSGYSAYRTVMKAKEAKQAEKIKM